MIFQSTPNFSLKSKRLANNRKTALRIPNGVASSATIPSIPRYSPKKNATGTQRIMPMTIMKVLSAFLIFLSPLVFIVLLSPMCFYYTIISNLLCYNNFMVQLSEIFTPEIIKFVLGKSFLTLLILISVFVGKRISSRIIRVALYKIGSRKTDEGIILTGRAKTLQSIANSALGITLYTFGILMILSQWGVNIAPLLAGAGILGLAVGFGTQTLVKDIITGFFILLEGNYNIGTEIEIAGIKGEVKKINLRTTVLKTGKNTIHIIPNSKITDIAIMKK